MSLDLATIASDPERIADLGPAALPALIGEAEALRAQLWARLQAISHPSEARSPSPEKEPEDHLLTVEEVARHLGVDKRWVYRRAAAGDLPFARKLSAGTLRFSRKGLERWKATR